MQDQTSPTVRGHSRPIQDEKIHLRDHERSRKPPVPPVKPLNLQLGEKERKSSLPAKTLREKHRILVLKNEPTQVRLLAKRNGNNSRLMKREPARNDLQKTSGNDLL